MSGAYYFGIRGKEFKKKLKQLFDIGNVEEKFADLIIDDNIERFDSVFTHEIIDVNNNYQVDEIIGDSVITSCLVLYFLKRFPQLKQSKYVCVLARLKIKYISKDVFSSVVKKHLKLDEFISVPYNIKKTCMDSVYEDVFEAFVGASYQIIQDKYGSGIDFVTNFLTKLYDSEDISLEYENLYDPITRLKETYDMYNNIGDETLTKIEYVTNKDENTDIFSVYIIDKGTKYRISDIFHNIDHKKAKEYAANDALKYLKSIGKYKLPPSKYIQLSENKHNMSKSTDITNKIGNENINTLYQSRGKSKQNKDYKSTVLHVYCYEQDVDGVKECIKRGANPNIKDTDGMTCFDIIYSAKYNDVLRDILDLLTKSLRGNKPNMTKESEQKMLTWNDK